MELKKVVLHNPIHIGGHNLGEKLIPDRKGGMKLIYDRDHKELHVEFLKEYAIVPLTNVSYMVPAGQEPEKPQPPTPRKAVVAQAETPTSHVFAGEGAGRTKRQ